MAGTSIYSVYRRTARAAAKQQVVKKTSNIDVERAPNASTNALTTEDGLILLFDPEDDNRDGQIDTSEQDVANLGQLFEESPLQLFDIFPKVRFA